ncbi:MAG: HAMP domain-containing protein [Halorubrum sp.]|uniref:HAMP domain-containing protein n=1 Tax=Halorubrum sp. TaxID=1879286 RepID=UPI003970D7D0
MQEGPFSGVRSSYGAKLALSLIGVTGISVTYGAVVYLRTEGIGAVGAEIRSGLIGMTLLTVIGLALIGVTVGSNTVISLRRLTAKAERMAEGDLDVTLETGRTDEIGRLFEAFDAMRGSLRAEIDDAETAREEAEAARREASERTDTSMTEITRATETQADSVDAVVGHVEDVSAISAQTASAAGDVTGAVDEQERTLGAVETAAESLSDRASRLRAAAGGFEFAADGALAGADSGDPDAANAAVTAVSDGGTAGGEDTDFDFSHGGGVDDGAAGEWVN